MTRKKKIVMSNKQLINEIDSRIAKGEKVKTMASELGLHAGIIKEYVRLTKLKHKQEREALQVKETEYLNCFADYFTRLNDERRKRD